jgi:hypothetical protein
MVSQLLPRQTHGFLARLVMFLSPLVRLGLLIRTNGLVIVVRI